MSALLLVSLSGIGPRTLHRCADLAAQLDRRAVPVSLLCAPTSTTAGPVRDWVAERASGADELLLHGHKHDRLGGRAEFATLPAHEAGLRLTAALATMEGVGLGMRGFVPPRWLASRGTVQALARHDIPLCADATAVRNLLTGEVHRGRVHGAGHGLATAVGAERAETLRCFALVLAAARSARRGGLVRIAVDAVDLVRPAARQAVLDAVDVALEAGAAGVTYPGLFRRTAGSQRPLGSSRVSTRTSVPSGARLVNSP